MLIYAFEYEKSIQSFPIILHSTFSILTVEKSESIPSEFGVDSVNFLLSANPGQPLAPLVEVASGGEMSRFLLALKTVLSNVDS